MAQTLVQMNAPADIRGRVIGLFNMAGLGMRAFSGITVGLLGAAIGIHWSLGLSAAVLLACLSVLYRRRQRAARVAELGLKDQARRAPRGPAAQIGIGGSLAAPPLPHHRTYGSVSGGSVD